MKAWKIGLIIAGVVGLAMASRLLEASGASGLRVDVVKYLVSHR